MSNDQRAVARRLAADSLTAGDPTGWFETLYAAAETGEATVPWADLEPNPHLVGWVKPGTGTALVVGCGYGDDAEHLASLGYEVTAFDVSATAVAGARRRFPESSVNYVVADLLDPPEDWAFDLVVEVYTVQVLQGAERRWAIRNIAGSVAPGGTLLVVARARRDDEPAGRMPWPLRRDEIDAFAVGGLSAVDVEEFTDDEDPPVHRWRAEFRRQG